MDDGNGARPAAAADSDASHDLRRRAWWIAVAVAAASLALLSWLLARLLWLPFYFGLFFFLVAGLLGGGISFRFGRPARPVAAGRIVRGISLAVLVCGFFTLYCEYQYFAETVGDEPKFPAARNAAVAAGRSPNEVRSLAAAEFKSRLRTDHPPGGPPGYVLWTIGSAEMELTVAGETERISNSPRGLLWSARTLMALLLAAAGLWASLESLRWTSPVSNIIAPGEEAEAEET